MGKGRGRIESRQEGKGRGVCGRAGEGVGERR